MLIIISVAAAAIGLVARHLAVRLRSATAVTRAVVERITVANGATRFLYRASLNKWWFDDLNDLLFIRHRRTRRGRPVVVRPDRSSTARSTASASATRDAGGGLRRIQTGRVQNYALGIAIGLLVMAGSFLVIVGQPR